MTNARLAKFSVFAMPPALGWGLMALGAIALSLIPAGLFQRDLVNAGGWPQLWRFIRASLHPDLSPNLLHVTGQATLQTLAYAVCGTCLSVILGCVGGLLSSEVWWKSVLPQQPSQATRLWWMVRAVLVLPRAIHELIWGLLFVNILGTDPLTAILAIAIPFGAIVAKVFSEILDETPRQPLQALLNAGVAPLPAFFYTLLPQAFLNLLSYTFYRFECSIRSATVLGLIGAGGLGNEILLSLQSLQYEQLWTFFYALFVLNGLVDVTSAWLRQRLGCASRLDLNAHRTRLVTPNPKLSPHRSHFAPDLLAVGLFLLLLIPFCFWYVHADIRKLWAGRTYHLLGRILQESLPPNFSLLPQLPQLAAETVAMSILAIALAAIGGLILSFPAAHNFVLPGGLMHPSRRGGPGVGAWAGLLLSRAILLMGRAIPAPVWALVVLFVLFPGILPGAIALGLHNLGILGRLKAEVIENLDQRPLEALKAQGTPASLVFLYGVVPSTLPRFLAYDLYRWEVCMRETAIVGIVGAGGLGYLMTEQLSSFDYRGLVVTLSCFIALTLIVDWVSARARHALR